MSPEPDYHHATLRPFPYAQRTSAPVTLPEALTRAELHMQSCMPSYSNLPDKGKGIAKCQRTNLLNVLQAIHADAHVTAACRVQGLRWPYMLECRLVLSLTLASVLLPSE